MKNNEETRLAIRGEAAILKAIDLRNSVNDGNLEDTIQSEIECLETDCHFLSGGLLTAKGVAEVGQRIKESELWIDELITELKKD